MSRMVVIDGLRYRVEDAERLGLLTPKAPRKKAREVPNKAATPKNK